MPEHCDLIRKRCVMDDVKYHDKVNVPLEGVSASQTGDGVVDQEVAVLYTGELTNCLWAEKAEH